MELRIFVQILGTPLGELRAFLAVKDFFDSFKVLDS